MTIRVDFIKNVFKKEKSVISNIMSLFVCFSISNIGRGLFSRQKTYRVLLTLSGYATLCFRILFHQCSIMFRFSLQALSVFSKITRSFLNPFVYRLNFRSVARLC